MYSSESFESMESIIFDNSEIIQNIAESYCTFTKQQVVDDFLDGFSCNLPNNTCKRYLVDIIDGYAFKYASIDLFDCNISHYVQLAEYFCLDESFIMHIVDKYILAQNKFYDSICGHESVNKLIIRKFCSENDIDNCTFEYLHLHNKTLFDDTRKLSSSLINNHNLAKFNYLVELNVSNNQHAINESIKHMRLHSLNVSLCRKITNDCIEHMHYLTKLNARANSGITDFGIRNMNLSVLDASDNCSITDKSVKHMSQSLRTLYAFDNDSITANCTSRIKHVTVFR